MTVARNRDAFQRVGFSILVIARNIFARLAQSVEHETLNLKVVGSSPTLGVIDFAPSPVVRNVIEKKNIADGRI